MSGHGPIAPPPPLDMEHLPTPGLCLSEAAGGFRLWVPKWRLAVGQAVGALGGGGGGGQGVALIFIPAGGGGPLPLGPPPSLPWTPSPPRPSTLIHLRIRVLGTFFRLGQFFSSHAFGALIAGFFGHSSVSFLPSVADTMSQRPISAFFGTPVQPCPRVKRDDVVNGILYFRFQDRWTGGGGSWRSQNSVCALGAGRSGWDGVKCRLEEDGVGYRRGCA